MLKIYGGIYVSNFWLFFDAHIIFYYDLVNELQRRKLDYDALNWLRRYKLNYNVIN